jgi:hypothetical protein
VVGVHHAEHVSPSIPQKLALTSSTSGARSVGIVPSRTQATEISLVLYNIMFIIQNNIIYNDNTYCSRSGLALSSL